MTLPLLDAQPVPATEVRCLRCRRVCRNGTIFGFGPGCAEIEGVVVRRHRLASWAADQPLFEVDPLATSVAAYTDRVDAYAVRNAAKMAGEVARFAGLLPAAALVLDAGCGPGRDLERFADAGLRPVGLDLNPQMAARASEHAPVVVADLRAMPLPTETFDAVWACASLVHLGPLAAGVALTDLHRVTTPGGLLFAAVKCGDGSGWQVTAIGRRWFHRWTPAQFAAAVEQAGWEITSMEVGPIFVDVWARKERP